MCRRRRDATRKRPKTSNARNVRCSSGRSCARPSTSTPRRSRWRDRAAGITTILATPAGDAIRGQSALVNTALPSDAPQIGAVADDRRGQLIVKSPVALHVTFAQRPGGGTATRCR